MNKQINNENNEFNEYTPKNSFTHSHSSNWKSPHKSNVIFKFKSLINYIIATKFTIS